MDDLVKGIFEEGVNTSTLVILNAVLLTLFLPIFALLYLTLKAGFAYVHVLIFLSLAVGLLISINWFVLQVGIADHSGAPPPAALGSPRTEEDTAAHEKTK
mmetsp:Transcript_37731/g.52395  ORF Transcript_37731/g.52395 Transcript_37731/m.52395 type:complete len:101 (-) Transcript_37731:180-482(-)